VLTDSEWQELRVPTQFLVGENEVTYPAHEAIRRLGTVAPQVTTSIAPDADHHLAICTPGWVSDHVIEFLADRRG
jgi:pimeloyl-ACP methyl ester carboxylesterase